MPPGDRNQLSFWIRGGTIFVTLIILFTGLSASPAEAYSGGSTLSFDGSPGSIDGVALPQEYILGTSADCLSTKSVTAWVRPTGPSPTAGVPADLGTIAGNQQVFWGISRGISQSDSNQDAIWVFTKADNYPHWYDIPIPYNLGEWVHVAYVQGGGTLSAYRNGVLVSTIAAPPTDIAFWENSFGAGFHCGHLSIAQPGEPSVSDFGGQIDEVGFWSIALTAADIRRTMYRGLNGSESGLAAYYKMDEGSGSTVTDSSGHGFIGQITGSPTWETSGALAGPRQALEFDGTSQSVSIADPGTGSILDLTGGGLTFEAWVNSGAWNNNVFTPFAVKGDGTLPEVNYYFGKSETNKLVFGFYNAGLLMAIDSSQVTFSDNTWYHLAYVVNLDAHMVSFYRNGVYLSTVSFPVLNVPANNQPLTLANYPGAIPAQYFLGQLDEVRLWNTERTAKQIVDNMFQTLEGDEAGLVAYFRFDQYDPAESTLYDVTAHNLDGNLSGIAQGVQWVASSAFNTWIGTDSSDWAADGNWSRNQVPVPDDNVGIYSYPGGNDAYLSESASVSNLIAAGNASLIVSSSGRLTVVNNLLNNGSLTQVRNLSGNADIGFFDTGNYGGLLVNPGGDNLGDTSVTILGNGDCTNAPGNAVRRCFDITPSSNNGTINKSITFFYSTGELSGNACDAMGVFYNEGNHWLSLPLDPGYGTAGRQCTGDPLSVKVMNVTAFSPYILNQSIRIAIPLVIFSGSTGESQIGGVTPLITSFMGLYLFLWLWKRLEAG